MLDYALTKLLQNNTMKINIYHSENLIIDFPMHLENKSTTKLRQGRGRKINKAHMHKKKEKNMAISSTP